MRHPRLFAVSALAVGLSLTAFAAPQRACGCVDPRPARIAEVKPAALEVVCTSRILERSPDALREEGLEHGFQFWGDWFEATARDGGLDVRPGAAGEDCRLSYLTDRAGARRVEAALTRWARSREMRRLDARRWAGAAEVGRLSWTVEVPSRSGAPYAVTVTYAPPSGD